MPDTDIPAEGQEAPAETPATLTAEQIAEIVKEGIDSRIPGLQSSYDSQINELKTQLRQQSMSDEEILDERESELETQLAAAQRDAALQKAARLYPEAAPVFEQILGASTPEDQLRILTEKLSAPVPAAPAPTESSQEEPVPPPVDPNNPPAGSGTELREGVEMNRDLADRILDAAGTVWPGRG